jgi:hypothetical protein
LRVIRESAEYATSRLRCRSAEVELPHSKAPAIEALQELSRTGTPLEKKWAAHLLEKGFQPSRTLSLQRIDLADNVSLIAMNGEMCCEFGHFIKRNQPEKYVLPIGYSNGLIGYICPTRHYAEGGYEPYESTLYLGMPAPFRPDNEDRICAALTPLLAD